MHDLRNTHRRGMILVIAVCLVVMLVLLCSSYLGSMSRYRAGALHRERRVWADLALDAGKAHAIHVLQRQAAIGQDEAVSANDHELCADMLDAYGSRWQSTFQADPTLDDSAIGWQYGGNGRLGGFFLHGDALEENVPQTSITYEGNYDGQSGSNYDDPLYAPVFDAISYGMVYGRGHPERTYLVNGGARWFNHAYLDRDFRPVDRGDRETARYRARYAVMIQSVAEDIVAHCYPEDAYQRDSSGAVNYLSDELRLQHSLLRERMAYAYLGNSSQRMLLGDSNSTGGTTISIEHAKRIDAFEAAGHALLRSASGGDERHYYDTGKGSSFHRLSRLKERDLMLGHGNMWLATSYCNDSRTTYQPMRRRVNPGPLYQLGGRDVNYMGTGGTRTFLMTPFGMGYSRRRGDDIDSSWRISLLNSLNVLHDATDRGMVGFGLSGTEPTIIGFLHTGPSAYAVGYELLPPAQGASIFADDAYVAATDGGYDRYYTPEETGDYGSGKALQHRDHDGNPDTPALVYIDTGSGPQALMWDHDGDPTTPEVQRKAVDSWLENSARMRREFYALTGNEGRDAPPLMPLPFNGFDTRFNGSSWVPGDAKPFPSWQQVTSYNAGSNWNELNTLTPPISTRDGSPYMVQDDYRLDVMVALRYAINCTRRSWVPNLPKDSSGHAGTTTRGMNWTSGTLYNMRRRLLTIHDVHRLFLNMLGEDVSNTPLGSHWMDADGDSLTPPNDGTASGSLSGRSWEEPANWRATRGFLSGRRLYRNGSSDTKPGDNNWWIPMPNAGFRDATWARRTDPWNSRQSLATFHLDSVRLRPGMNTRGMERFLNDVRIAYFGTQYVDANGDLQAIPPLDFNHDGFAESSLHGYNDGTITPPTSAQLDSHGPRPWNRNRGGNPYWSVDSPYLRKEAWFPDQPFTVNGRLHMGKTNLYRITVRGQLWDQSLQGKAAERNIEFVYCVNPSDDPDTLWIEDDDPDTAGHQLDLNDSHILYQRPLVNFHE